MILNNDLDPFAIRSFGSRPSFAAYWSDTRFIELYPSSDYFQSLIGRRIKSDDEDVLHLAESVLHHERIHWQVSHSLTWGMVRCMVNGLGTTLASHFMRYQSPAELRERLIGRQNGVPLVPRNRKLDVVIDSKWEPTLHTVAEHAWLCRILPFLIDTNDKRLSGLRPPEYMIGILAQYLSNHCQVTETLEESDQHFQERVKSFKLPEDDFSNTISGLSDVTAMAVEECLAVIGQINYLNSLVPNSDRSSAHLRRFQEDLLSGVFASGTTTYSGCFHYAMSVFNCEFDELDLDLIGLICEIALDPPLDFLTDGTTLKWDWSSFHPAARFTRLIRSWRQNDRKSNSVSEMDRWQLCSLEQQLLEQSGLERAQHNLIKQWLAKFDPDNTAWPSEELVYEQVETAKSGRIALNDYPGLLFDRSRLSTNYVSASFYDLPYVLIDGASYSFDEDNETQMRAIGQHALNGFLSRATDHLAFRTGKMSLQGLPTNEEDAFAAFSARSEEFFHTTLHIGEVQLGL